MTTPTHVIVNQVLLVRNAFDQEKYGKWILLGALLPDFPIYILTLWSVVAGIPQDEVWDIMYFSDFWNIPTSIGHSFVVVSVLFVLSWIWKKRILMYVSASMFLHSLFDFPLHADDGHRHLYPLSDWRFESPISYWDPRYFGDLVGSFEVLVFFGSWLLVLRRMKKKTWQWWAVCILGALWLFVGVVMNGFLLFQRFW